MSKVDSKRACASAAPPSGQKPQKKLRPKDVDAMADELVDYHAQFHDLFARREQREWSAFYLRGQLSEIERKTVEPMVLALRGDDAAAVRAVQQFLGEGAWDDDRILERVQRLVAEDLGETDAMVIVDGSSFPKQGRHSVGVARQYCGHLGKVANCQHGVFAAYASSRGCTFLDRRLYVHKSWFDDAHALLRERYGVPEKLKFATEPALALEMVRGLAERGAVPFAWVLGDETYGADPKFLDGVEALAKRYFVEVAVSTRVWVGAVEIEPAGKGPMGRRRTHVRVASGTPKPREVRRIAEELAASAWRRYRIKEGARGTVEADFAFLRVTRSWRKGRPGAEAWLVLRRSTGEDRTVKYFLTNAPAACAKRELARVSGQRWPIETAFEEAKGEVGMDHYEVRTWRGWHHHMTQTFLAHHFLVRTRLRGKKSGADDGAGETAAGGHSARGRHAHRGEGHRDRPVPPGAELCRVLLTPTAHGKPFAKTQAAA